MRANIKYRIIYHHKDKYVIKDMCKFLNVSKSGYYDWVKKLNAIEKDSHIAELIRECQNKTKNTYGYRRVKLWIMRKTGLVINHKAVLRIMSKYGLLSEIRRRRKYQSYNEQLHKYENMLNRNFHADKPNIKWVTDISYIFTKQGVLYLSIIKDLYDNFIIAYDMATSQDNSLVYRTIKKAKKEVADGLILHSDQGFQYTSTGYFNLTKEYHILPSMSRAGTPLDNACVENFFGTLKSELINRVKPATYEEARFLIDEYINFYNFERLQLKTKLTPYEKRCQSRAI